MKDLMKLRYGLLRLYASMDEEYQQLLRNAKSAELRLEQWEDDLPEDLIDAMWGVIGAYDAVEEHMTQLACRHMVFRSEIRNDTSQKGM